MRGVKPTRFGLGDDQELEADEPIQGAAIALAQPTFETIAHERISDFSTDREPNARTRCRHRIDDEVLRHRPSTPLNRAELG